MQLHSVIHWFFILFFAGLMLHALMHSKSTVVEGLDPTAAPAAPAAPAANPDLSDESALNWAQANKASSDTATAEKAAQILKRLGKK